MVGVGTTSAMHAQPSGEELPRQDLVINRFQVVQDLHSAKHTYLLDTASGRTWLGAAGPKGEDIWTQVCDFDADGKEQRTLTPRSERVVAPLPQTEQ